MRFALLGAVLTVLLIVPLRAGEELIHDSGNLEQLLSEVQRILPTGWQAEITPNVPHEIFLEASLSDGPSLTIWRTEKVLGDYEMPNPPQRNGNNPEVNYEPTLLYFQLTLRKFLTPQQYREAAEKNVDGELRRNDFRRGLVEARVTFSVTPDSEPYRPANCLAQTSEQKELVRRYAFLWMQTEPVKLPEYYYRSLALDANFVDHLILQDKQIDAERQELRKGVVKLLKAYTREPEVEESR